jgi:hypothetical protein
VTGTIQVRDSMSLQIHTINMALIGNIGRSAAAAAYVLLGLLAGPVVLAPGAAATSRPSMAPFPASNVDIVGFGNGSGLGMGQWGAFGYAALGHRSYQWILGHYYGGTALSSSANLVSTNPTISVDLNENDGDPVVVTSDSAFSFGGIFFPGGRAVRAVESQGTWTLSDAPECSSKQWAPVASDVVNPIAVPSSVQPSATLSQVLTICEHDGVDLPVRGTVEAYDSPAGAVTLSILPIEEYLRSVVSAEVSWSWGLFGGRTGSLQGHPWGFQALEAQAVAARSYAAAEIASGGWAAYATSCDSYCQSYPGMADESPMLNAAVRDTAGEILEEPETSGTPSTSGTPGSLVVPATPGIPETPVFTEYSASSGGYTASGEFPGVVDDGDAVCIKSHFYTCNPCHRWLAKVPVSAVEKVFPSIGKLAEVDVTERNGVGQFGGRVVTVEIVGTTGTKVSASSSALGALISANNPEYCASDWYAVTNGP